MKRTRRVVQFGFLAVTLIGVFVVKGNAERWCPFGGVEAAYSYIREGSLLCSLGVSNFYILGAVLLLALLARRAFCGYACPIGTISEWLQAGAGKLGVKALKVPPLADRILAKLKYVVLAVILYFTWRAAELEFRAADPCYALLSRHGEDITFWAYVVAGAVVLASLTIVLPFCRWFCPLAAVFNPFSRFGLTRITRHEHACVNCGKCSRVCPMAIPVAKVPQVTHARCISCMNCLEACPTLKQGALSWGPPVKWSRPWPQAAVIGILLGMVASAVAATYIFPIPSFVKERGERPAAVETLELSVEELTCRGRATLFAYFLERQDEFEVPGYLRLEAWPGPGLARAVITFDPAQTTARAIQEAITEPFYELETETWRSSPFRIEGYDPLLDAEP